MLKIFTKKHQGFTLIELLVVIAIIGILSSIVLVSMGGARKSARDGVRRADIVQVAQAIELSYADNQAYPSMTGWPSAIGTYMVKTPSDPGSTAYAAANNSAALQSFCIWAVLESGGAKGNYFAASQAGNFQCATLPTLAACCF
ncbi:MAG: type II secretion system protein [Candidatus Nealsonbacteria bacterium]|nr:type II secretion system protein [Candidatus Nealsonbacteria bacterium]